MTHQLGSSMVQPTGNRCGIGICLKFSSDHIYKAYFAGGEGSNMKAELQGLWGLLHLASLFL
jgi:hypothetical protein